MCSSPPCLSENNIDSICDSETLGRDTVYISFKGNEDIYIQIKLLLLPSYMIGKVRIGLIGYYSR